VMRWQMSLMPYYGGYVQRVFEQFHVDYPGAIDDVWVGVLRPQWAMLYHIREHTFWWLMHEQHLMGQVFDVFYTVKDEDY